MSDERPDDYITPLEIDNFGWFDAVLTVLPDLAAEWTRNWPDAAFDAWSAHLSAPAPGPAHLADLPLVRRRTETRDAAVDILLAAIRTARRLRRPPTDDPT